MHTLLLATKLRIPPHPYRAVHRARLIDLLERSIPHSKLILLSAPPGYGKTTLLTEWAHGSQFSIAWLSLGEEDNDLDRFLRYLLMAWEKVQPDIRESPAGLLLSGIAPDNRAVLSECINFADTLSVDTLLVLDNYHLIEEPSIHEALTFLLDHLPSKLHLVLAGRADPPLPLARFRAHQELLELRAGDLQFVLEETAEFLQERMGLDLSHDEIVTLQAQLEGWAASLQLVALTLQRQPALAAELAVSGRHRFIADYLHEEVFGALPEVTRQFLLQTSILDRLCASLCDAVTKKDDGQIMLDRLEQQNLFLASLDERRGWFRYHYLFADFLRAALSRDKPAEIATLHRRAARWYLAHDLPEQAYHHALIGEDVELVIQIAERYVTAKLMGGEVTIAQHWLHSIPATWYAGQPRLAIFKAIFLFFTGQFDACSRCLDEVEQRLVLVESADRPGHLARVTAVRCLIACFQNNLQRAEEYADQALRELPESDVSFRPGIYGSLGDTYRRHGRWAEAKACYVKTLAFTHAPAVHVASVHVFGALADLELRQGRLSEAARNWSNALAVLQDEASWGKYPLPVSGWVFIRLGEILYEWNRLAEAGDHLSRGLERATLGGDMRALIAGYLLAGRLQLTTGHLDIAAEYLERARPLVEQAPFPESTSRFERFQLELWLAQDRLRTVVTWADMLLQGSILEQRPDNEEARLALARALIVKEDLPSLERALTLIDGLLQTAELEGRVGLQIEALALQALARWRRRERTSALVALEHALRLAEPEGYVRIFADLGLPMARLLQEARSRAVLPTYVATLLSAFGSGSPLASQWEAALPDPLTAREQEILTLIAAGLTNREIGEVLVISPDTVKKHTINIYGKLSVRSRREAVARARELALLG